MSSRSKNSVTSFARDSLQMFSPGMKPQEAAHPFENELSQVTEMVEEIGSNMMVLDEEEQELMSRGFFKFSSQDYMEEISGLFMNAFGDRGRQGMETMWI